MENKIIFSNNSKQTTLTGRAFYRPCNLLFKQEGKLFSRVSFSGTYLHILRQEHMVRAFLKDKLEI